MRGNGLSKHHFFWPKKKFPDASHRSKHVWVKRIVHEVYHNQFYKNCRTPSKRTCWNGYCKYQNICCYHRSTDTF